MLHSGALFDFVSLPYELVTRHPVWERHCAEMATHLPAGARRVLDLGCGPGNSTVHLGKIAVGGDYSMTMLRRARRRGATVAAMDAGVLPVRDESVDAVTFHSVLYLLPDRPRTLAETARVLRKGGRAILLEPQAGTLNTVVGLASQLRTPVWAAIASLWRTMSRLYGRFTPQEMQKALEDAGLRVVRIEDAFGGLGLLAVAEK